MTIIETVLNNQVFGGFSNSSPNKTIIDDYVASASDYLIVCDFATEKNITLSTTGSVFIVKNVGIGAVNFLTDLDGISNFKLYKGGSVVVANYEGNFIIVASAGYGI